MPAESGKSKIDSEDFAARLPKVVSANEMAWFLGVNRRTLLDFAAKGIVSRNSRGQYHLVDSVHRYTRHLREQAAGRANTKGGKSLTDERAELTAIQKQREQLLLDRETRSVLTFEEVKDGWTRIATKTKSTVLGLTSRIRFALPHLTSFDGEAIAGVCREALEEIASELDGTAEVPGADKADLRVE